MINKKSTKTIIYFREKIFDHKILVNYTTDFLTNLFVLAKRKYNNKNTKNSVTKIHTNLSKQLTEYSKTLDQQDNMIEINMVLSDENPIIQSESSLTDSNILLMVTFQKIDWDEINIFRPFLLRYLTLYLKEKTKLSTNKIKQLVTNLSFVIQEFLQNANQYGIGDYGYELTVSYKDNKIAISVKNYTNSDNAIQLQSIVDEITNAEDMHDLILKYMLNSQKHLGLISSVFNNYISNLTCKINQDNLVYLEALIETKKD